MKKEPWPALREATAAAHLRLEELPRVSRLFATDYRPDELAELLAIQRAIHLPLERVLASGIDLAAFGYRPRWPLLDADLVHLGWRGAIAEIAFIPPPPACPATLLGICYVIEGAMLGGEVIRKRLIERFGREIVAACAFFSPYGAEAGEQWRRFRHRLDAELTSPAALATCIDAALFTFAHFERALAASY